MGASVVDHKDGAHDTLLESFDTSNRNKTTSQHRPRLSLLTSLDFVRSKYGRSQAFTPQRILVAALTAVASIAVLYFYFRAPPPGPAPFYCSTWDSAVAVPADAPGAIEEYEKWAGYDLSQHPLPDLGPFHGPHMTSRVGLSDKPKNVAKAMPPKPKGFKGGYLDEVHFIEHTTDPGALEWLHNMVDDSPGYKALQVGPECSLHPHSDDCRYERIWEHFATDPDTLYIKIDDDIIYIHEETIPRLVQTRLAHPHPFAISANIINSPLTAWMHYHNGAIYPYLPELHPEKRKNIRPTWRASELSFHPNDSSFQTFDFGPTPDTALLNSIYKDDAALYKAFDRPPFPGHRWLPLSQNSTSILSTPISRISADPWGVGVHNWAVSAQQQYSLLQNIENKTLHKYHIAPLPPHGDGIWYPQYTRYNLNFIAVWGRDIAAGASVREDPQTGKLVSNMKDDEKNITVDMPRTLGRPMVIDAQALVAHMHFHDQEVGIQMTDLLDRWRTYVNEMVCSDRRRKEVPGQYNGLGWKEGNAWNGWWQCPWIG